MCHSSRSSCLAANMILSRAVSDETNGYLPPVRQIHAFLLDKRPTQYSILRFPSSSSSSSSLHFFLLQLLLLLTFLIINCFLPSPPLPLLHLRHPALRSPPFLPTPLSPLITLASAFIPPTPLMPPLKCISWALLVIPTHQLLSRYFWPGLNRLQHFSCILDQFIF